MCWWKTQIPSNVVENSISKMNFNFERKIGKLMCIDAVAVNVKLYKLIKPTAGDHYMDICPGHWHQVMLSSILI